MNSDSGWNCSWKVSVRSDITPASNRFRHTSSSADQYRTAFYHWNLTDETFPRSNRQPQSPQLVQKHFFAAPGRDLALRVGPISTAAGLANAGILISTHTQAHGSGETVVPETGTCLSTHTGQKDWCWPTPEYTMLQYLITP
jgi:hypothetical protein